MVYLAVVFFFICVTSLHACPEPMTVHIENYEGPIILHTANCDNQQYRNHGNLQLRNHGNQNKHNSCCETECTCVSKLNYAPYYSGSVATNVGSGCCPVADVNPVVYCVCEGYGCNGYPNSVYGNQGCQKYPNCHGKYSGYH